MKNCILCPVILRETCNLSKRSMFRNWMLMVFSGDAGKKDGIYGRYFHFRAIQAVFGAGGWTLCGCLQKWCSSSFHWPVFIGTPCDTSARNESLPHAHGWRGIYCQGGTRKVGVCKVSMLENELVHENMKQILQKVKKYSKKKMVLKIQTIFFFRVR